jgi:hypothetical protein
VFVWTAEVSGSRKGANNWNYFDRKQFIYLGLERACDIILKTCRNPSFQNRGLMPFTRVKTWI